ncbi:hypothetical protein PR202_ga14811 [Eleusine coracana subsp. coracana]|uniref:Response regulatory domain-containing protein n=1 Tax=Eleusine coracana subsp. coracana TaxID=191504 RepID=A0AAV5CIE9_ELECO|nr:hypothetical protein PR202_ga14811 [Eleusine coracana subsp. coracana]
MDVDEFRARLRVLAVDDDHVSLLLITKQLRLCKYNVTTVMHPEMALEMLRARRDNDDQFDLVITDLHMPGMDGFKLLKLIVISANETLAAMIKGIEHGARDYLVKPVCLDQLKRLCLHVVRKVKDDQSYYINNTNDNDEAESETGVKHTMKCSRKKRKDGDGGREGKENTSTPKRQRIQWSVFHSERNVHMSCFQKYRLYMKKLSSGTFRTNSPFTDEALWRQGNSININCQEHFEHNLEHGRYQPSLNFSSSSNLSNPFAMMNSPAAFGTHSLLPTQSVQLMNQRNLAIPFNDMGPVGYGGNMPQIVAPRSQQGLSNFTSAQNSNTDICFPSGPSGSSFANISNGMTFNTSKPFPSGTSSNSFANIPNGSSPVASSMEPHYCPIKSYASLVHGNFEGASKGNPLDGDNFFESIGDGDMLPPSSNLLMHPSESVAPYELDCKDTTTEAGGTIQHREQHKLCTMTNDNSALGGATSVVSTLPNPQMNKPSAMPNQMLNDKFEGGTIDQQAVGDQLNNNNEFLTAASSVLNVTNDALDDFFGDWLNQDVLKNDDAFMGGNWEFTP